MGDPLKERQGPGHRLTVTQYVLKVLLRGLPCTLQVLWVLVISGQQSNAHPLNSARARPSLRAGIKMGVDTQRHITKNVLFRGSPGTLI